MRYNLEKLSLNEIYNLAYNYELKLYKLYKNKDEIFQEIAKIRAVGVEIFKNNFPNLSELDFEFESLENSQDMIFLAIGYELELCKFYENATNFDMPDEIKDIFYRLWATSNNEYIAALKDKLGEQKSYKKDENLFDFRNFALPDEANDFLQMAEKIASGKASKDEISKVVNSPNFSFFSGAALGGFALIALRDILNKDEKGE